MDGGIEAVSLAEPAAKRTSGNARGRIFLVQLPYLLAQILVTGLLFFWHYGANRLWTFARGG